MCSQMKPLLSICIPTYNRLPYLKGLVECLVKQLDAVMSGRVELLVSDNVSADGTAAFCKTISRSYFRWWTNATNVGGDRNFLKCIREAAGDYVWLVGDDDVVPPDAVARALGLLETERPDLLVSDAEVESSGKAYAGYGEFLAENCRRDCSAALRHTLISANVFRRDCFDLAFAEEKLYTQYAHMFGLMKNLDGKVVLTSGLIEVRPVRAAFAKYPSCLCVKQALYLAYLANRFDQTRFRRFAFFNACNLPVEYASRLKNWLARHLRGA